MNFKELPVETLILYIIYLCSCLLILSFIIFSIRLHTMNLESRFKSDSLGIQEYPGWTCIEKRDVVSRTIVFEGGIRIKEYRWKDCDSWTKNP